MLPDNLNEGIQEVANSLLSIMQRSIATVLPKPFKSGIRQRIAPIKRLWTNSPLVQYLDHRRTDVYLISYPRSGRTWLRTMLGTALCNHFSLNISSPELIAELWQKHSDIPVIRLSHSEIRLPNPKKFHQKKVILLVRNPLDIGVSRYHYKQRPGAMTDHASHTVREVVNCYNTWATYMVKNSSNCLLIKYEDLLHTPEDCLRRIFDFMELSEMGEPTLSKTIDACSFKNLKQLANDPTRSLFYRPNNSEMVRSGKSGSSKTELPQETYDELKELVQGNLNPTFGYTVA